MMLDENSVNLLNAYLIQISERIKELSSYRNNKDSLKNIEICINGSLIKLNIPINKPYSYIIRYQKFVFCNFSALKILTDTIFRDVKKFL